MSEVSADAVVSEGFADDDFVSSIKSKKSALLMYFINDYFNRRANYNLSRHRALEARKNPQSITKKLQKYYL